MIDSNNVQSINLSQFFDSVKFRSGSGYHSVIDFCIVMFYMLMILMKFSFVLLVSFLLVSLLVFSEFFLFKVRIRIMSSIRISIWNSLEKVILYMLKISTKFGVAPQSFCENQNSVQNQDQDQDHDITLDFNTRPTFHTEKTPTKFFLDSLLLRKLFCPHEKSTYVRRSRHQDRQTDRQTEIFFACFVF